MPRSAPKSHGPIRFALWIVYDLAWIAFAGLLFGTGAYAAGMLLKWAHGHWGWAGVAFSALPAYVLALLVIVVLMGLVRMASPKVTPGIYEKFKPGPFFALVWLTGLNNVVYAMPFVRTVHFIALLRYLYYRGMGMRTYYENWISPDVTIADAFMVTLGRGVNIGGRSSISGHLALPDRMIILPITIGDRSVVGAHCKIGPGCEIGPDAMVGANSTLSINVKMGEGSTVEAGSFVKTGTKIGPYEKWGGHPAVKVGDLRRPQTATVPAADPEAQPVATSQD